MTEQQREDVIKACEEASKLAPQEPLESTKVDESKVVCKMLLKGFPNTLLNVLQPLLSSLQAKKSNGIVNGIVDLENTKKYAMTILIEEV